MLQKIIAGFLGGVFYVLVTWGATLTGLLEWVKDFDPTHPMAGFSLNAPFSLMAICMFISIYIYHKWQPQENQSKTFGKLMIIGSSFALGATICQLSFMSIDGIRIGSALIIAGIFFGVSILISLLICSFYLFIRPLRKKNQTV